MRIRIRALRAATIALAAILALSCDNNFGLFSSVQQEKAQQGTKVFQETAVYTAFKLGSNYYAATATLNTRSTTPGSAWSRVAIVPGTYTLRSAVLDDVSATPAIYALIESGGSIATYKYTVAGGWTALPGMPAQDLTSKNAFTFDALFTANGDLYAEGHAYDATLNSATTNTFSLYHYSAGVFAVVTAFAPAPNRTIRGVVFGGGTYWFASEDKLFSGVNADASVSSDASAPFSGLSAKSIWGISSAGGNIYVTTTNGYIYSSASPSTPQNPNSTPLPLTQVIQLPMSGTSILVGTDANGAASSAASGYFEGAAVGSLVAGSSIGAGAAVAGSSAVFGTTVSNSAVHNFYYDPVVNSDGQNMLFVCASPGTLTKTYYGLYSSRWNGSSWDGWSAE
jgi:hypothetical protein